MQENIFNPLAVEMRLLFEALHDSGFTEQQAFELTKTYCSIAFVNQAINDSRYSRRTKQETMELMKKQLAKYKEKTSDCTADEGHTYSETAQNVWNKFKEALTEHMEEKAYD